MLAGPSFNRLNHWRPQTRLPRLSESDGGQGSQNMLGIHRALVPVMTGASLEAPQYDLPDLPQYHLLELRGRRGKERWKAKNIKSLRLCVSAVKITNPFRGGC